MVCGASIRNKRYLQDLCGEFPRSGSSSPNFGGSPDDCQRCHGGGAAEIDVGGQDKFEGETLSKKRLTGANLESLMDMLAGKDGMIRQKARESLVALGKPAVLSLIKVLQNSTSDQVRWEAAKALGAIGDTRSIAPLVKALADSDSDVEWLAAEALSKFKRTAWPPLLRALIKAGPNSGSLYQGAHHVLVNQKEEGFGDLLETLLTALERGALSESAIVAAHEILKRMKAKS